MGIQKDINQSKFRTEYQKAVVNLIFTSNWLNEKLRDIFERDDITSQQYNILRILRGAGQPISTLQIRQRMLDKMSDTSRIVDRLLVKGLVKKKISDTDKRLVDVSITTKGTNLLKKMDAYEDEMDGILAGLTKDETKTLNILLDKIREKK
ncbi:MAG: MarR family transcriptional regulator [Ferruginibacter sp.]